MQVDICKNSLPTTSRLAWSGLGRYAIASWYTIFSTGAGWPAIKIKMNLGIAKMKNVEISKILTLQKSEIVATKTTKNTSETYSV